MRSFFNFESTLAIQGGFGRSRIRRNCGCTLCLLHKLGKINIGLILKIGRFCNLWYARKKDLSRKAFQ